MRNLVASLILLVLFSCVVNEKKSDLDFYPVTKKDFSKFINKNDLRSSQDLAQDIHLVNNDYPIEISLYEDGRWYYNLDNLGDGTGTWKYEAGRLKLHAERILFDLNINIEAEQKGAKNLLIKFSDRHGPRTLKMENRNLN